jgi:hypothetical protein
VSTILKALKKLEQESRQNTQGLAPTHPIGASHALGKRVRKVWLWDRGKQWLIMATILAVVVSGAYWAMVSPKKKPLPATATTNQMVIASKQKIALTPQLHPVPPAPSPKPRPEAVVSPPAPQPSASLPQAAKVEAGPPADQPPKTAPVRRPPAPPLAKESRQPGVLPAPPKPETATGESVESPPPAPSEEPSQETMAPLPAETPPQAPPTPYGSSSLPPKYANLDRLEDGRLELQAISWAEDPDQRLAVINNRIVRQGQSIDEFAIVYIGADEVVVRQGASIWKLIFMAR